MLKVIIEREASAKSEDDKIYIGRIFTALNRDKVLKEMKKNGELKLSVTKRAEIDSLLEKE